MPMKPTFLIALVAALAACAPSPGPSGGGAETQNPRAPVVAEGGASNSGATGGSGTAAGPAGGESSPPTAGGAAGSDSSQIARLEREARALAHAGGCTADECRTAPVGVRPCGGPRAYVVYCAARTDSAALFAKLAELARAEEAFNKQNEMMSTCEFRQPPTTRLQGGSCVAMPGPVGEMIQ
jgi:hypothetical protein